MILHKQCFKLEPEKEESKNTLPASHLKQLGLKTSFYTIEFSSLGHTNPDAIKALKSVCQVPESMSSATSIVKQLLNNCAKISIACSQIIFYARKIH